MTKERQILPWDSRHQQDIKSGKYVREASNPLYHTPRWTKLSRAWRERHPLCAECLRHGRYSPAECVDHIVPFPICKDFFDTSNLQSLCNHCNMIKGEHDRAMIREYKQTHPDWEAGGTGGGHNLERSNGKNQSPGIGQAKTKLSQNQCKIYDVWKTRKRIK